MVLLPGIFNSLFYIHVQTTAFDTRRHTQVQWVWSYLENKGRMKNEMDVIVI